MDFNQIQELIRLVSKTKLSEFILKEGDFKLIIRNQPPNDGSGQHFVQTAQPIVSVSPAMPAPVVASPPPIVRTEPSLSTDKPAQPAGADENNSKFVVIKSPMVGTFYRSAAPEKPAYVKVGDTVDVGTVVCMIEAMKLFNEIESEVKGKIVKVLVDDSKPVEYDQPLFLVDPS